MKKGTKMTEEQRERVSKAQKKRFSNPSERKRISEIQKGKHPKSEFKKGHIPVAPFKKGQVPWNKDRKVGKVLICPVCRKEFYASPSKIKRGAKYCSHPCMYSDSSFIKKLSDSHIGQIPANIERLRKINMTREYGALSKDHKKKLSEAHKGKKLSEKTKMKLRGRTPWNRGIPLSKEQIEKRSESIKKSWLAHPELREKQSNVSRANLLRLYESGAFPKQENTKPEREIKAELARRGYKEGTNFIHQYKFMNKFMCDFCFPEQRVIVEVYGDFWHANPDKYPTGSPLHPHQIKDIKKDRAKQAYIETVDNHSWTYLVLWESDIKKDVSNCVDRIEEILKKKK